METVHVGDVGTIIKQTIEEDEVAVDISSATSLTMYFKKPDDTCTNVTPTFFTDGTDGIISYTVVSTSFFNKVGLWQVQTKVVMPTGTWYTDEFKFRVAKNLCV